MKRLVISTKIKRVCGGFLVALILLYAWAHYETNRLQAVFTQVVYYSEVMNYMEEKKRKSGEWPQNLDNFSAFLSAEIKREGAYRPQDRLIQVQEFSRKHRCSLSVTTKTSDKISYILYIDGEAHEYKADVISSYP